MPIYHTLGTIPPKRHTVFRKPDGTLYAEELVSTEGFSSLYSLVYHCHPPTIVKSLGTPYSVEPKIALEKHLRHTSLIGFKIKPEDDYLKSRKPVFIHEGSGTLKTGFGKIKFEYGDYLVIPRGTIYQMEFNDENNRLFIIESFSPIRTPKRYRNDFGQLEEHSPFCERDIKRPQNLETIDEKGDFEVLIKKQGIIYPYTYGTHPFDFVGWDGFHYPWAFSIHDFEPITGRLHQPPPVHQTFEGHNFVICSFVPRKYDYHPLAIPAPYNHSNVDSDEVLYYVDGPHPGTVEKSIGKERTEELAVMVDPFRPLMLTQDALDIEDESYHTSWQVNIE